MIDKQLTHPFDVQALSRKKDRLRKFVATKAYHDFHETYLAFVRDVIVPLIGDKFGVVFQVMSMKRASLHTWAGCSHSLLLLPHRILQRSACNFPRHRRWARCTKTVTTIVM
jgi:hypothetical protein